MRLKWDNHGIKSPLAKARGMGSAGEGTEHWIHQKLTAVVNIPLMVWLVWSITHMGSLNHDIFTAWLAQPINAVLMILAVLSVFYHAALGAQVIAEDYIHHEGLKFFKLMGIKVFFFAGSVACIFSILKVAL